MSRPILHRHGPFTVMAAPRAGHPLLDTATLAMFRGARLPPLNPADGARLPIHFTMHYIIRR